MKAYKVTDSKTNYDLTANVLSLHDDGDFYRIVYAISFYNAESILINKRTMVNSSWGLRLRIKD